MTLARRLVSDLARRLARGLVHSPVPAWVEALRAPSGSLPVFAYNYAAGGSGVGWDGVRNVPLTAAQAWTAPWWASWDVAKIVDGLGLQPSTKIGITPLGLLPASVQGVAGATLLCQARAYAPVTASTFAQIDLNMSNLPDDTNDGALELFWDTGDPSRNRFLLNDCNGATVATDIIATKVADLRAVYNYRWDGSALVGSVNGRPNITGAGTLHTAVANAVYNINNPSASDVPVYVTLVAVYTPQPAVDLPAMSAFFLTLGSDQLTLGGDPLIL